MKLADDTARGRGGWQGMNWIRQEKRLAIYLRDGCACVYCGAAAEDGAALSLDHVVPHSRGGANDATNLVTACVRCNSSRGNRSLKAFAAAVAAYVNGGATAAGIVAHVNVTRRCPLDRILARQLIARRGSAARALRTGGK